MTAFNTLAGLRAAETGDTMPTLTQGWYNKTFLSIAEPALVHDQFGMPATLPKGNGEQVLWRRWSKLAVNTTPVADGITPTGKSLSYVNVVGTVKWYGDWVGITDQVQFMHPDNVLTMATKRLGLQAAETSDTITRDVINAGTGFLRVTADSTNPATGVGARNTVQGVLTKKATDTAVTELEANDAKYFHGKMSASTKVATQPLGPAFVCIIHPYVAHSLINALSGFGDDFVPREKYASGGVAYMTEVGKYRNVRFLTSTRAKFWADTGGGTTVGTTAASIYRSTTGTAGDVYSCLFLAKEAFGVVKLAGASATYYDPPGGNSDPLHQRSTAGWKMAKTATILQDLYMKRVEVLAAW